jgi:hypothetical protein
MQHLATQHPFRTAVKNGWTTLIDAARPRANMKRFRPRNLNTKRLQATPSAPISSQAALSHAPVAAIDPVALTMLAVNRLAPATLRTSTNGRALTVTVEDARVAEIFRAALDEMQKSRGTDRLVDIVVAGESRAAGAMVAR